MKNTRLTQKH